MSGVAIVTYLLAHASAVTAKVPANQITAGATPINTPLPAISVTQISSTQRNIVGMNAAKYLVTERVQVTVQAKSYPDQKAILALIRAALPESRGSINGFACDSIVPSSEGPDVYDYEALIYEQSVDFIVKFTR